MKINAYRMWVQLVFSTIHNGYLKGFAEGKIFTGASKGICFPGLNCYSCPGAIAACPIGALQAELTERGFRFPFYVLGFLVVFAAIFGRGVCGFLCPFGLFQDLLNKIPFPKKLRSLPGEKILRGIKFLLLTLFVILLPIFVVDIVGQGSPWFCKYICPAGTLSGAILMIKNPLLRNALGFLYAWKLFLLIFTIFLSIILYRPFCRYFCPLGGFYGLFNGVSLFRYSVEEDQCIRCGKCQRVCPFDIPVYDQPNAIDCIRCGRCIDHCPVSCIQVIKPWSFEKKEVGNSID